MKLKAYKNLVGNNIVLLDNITPEEILTEIPGAGDYWFVNTYGGGFTPENSETLKPIQIVLLNEGSDSSVETDIIFKLNGFPIHVDFPVSLQNGENAVLTLTRNTEEEGRFRHPFLAKLSIE